MATTTSTTTATGTGNQQRHQSSILGDAERENLRDVYKTQTAILLSIACLGALLLLSINLVGVLFFKGYFKRKAKPAAPPCHYLQSLSHSRRCRYSTLLRRFSLEGHSDPMSASTCNDYDYVSGRPGCYGDTRYINKHADCVFSPEVSLMMETNAVYFRRDNRFSQETDFHGKKWKAVKTKPPAPSRKERHHLRRKCKHKRSQSLDEFWWPSSSSVHTTPTRKNHERPPSAAAAVTINIV